MDDALKLCRREISQGKPEVVRNEGRWAGVTRARQASLKFLLSGIAFPIPSAPSQPFPLCLSGVPFRANMHIHQTVHPIPPPNNRAKTVG
eukprot:63444-Chlamydomonas_euryale.AAC.1